MAPSPYRLRYFGCRCRGEPIRILFALTKTAFVDERVANADWATVKPTTPLGALPVLVEEGKAPLGQTNAILRHLATQLGLHSINPYADAVAEQLGDLMSDLMPFHCVNAGYYPGDKDALYTAHFVTARAKHFAILQNVLKKNASGWLVGDSLTYADILAATTFEFLEAIDQNPSKIYEGFPELKALKDRVFAIPPIAEHISRRADDIF